MVFVQDFGNRPDRNLRVVAVNDVVEFVKTETGQRVVQVGGDVKRCHPLAVGVMVCTFGNDDDFVAEPPLTYPAPDRAFVVTVSVNVRGVKRGATERENPVEQPKRPCFLGKTDHHRTLNKPRDRFF